MKINNTLQFQHKNGHYIKTKTYIRCCQKVNIIKKTPYINPIAKVAFLSITTKEAQGF